MIENVGASTRVMENANVNEKCPLYLRSVTILRVSSQTGRCTLPVSLPKR
jgi:hypothetical protein